ncbi:hypothetical protein E2C01_025307 [Portunus trituberculatus]|uniref:Uncharacterized protein n=1 Tax=Portunus trituberculatus TaxID=210409 RepID=A0A5B7EF49_PORTR|nr:hypothetical protein [Portunus trituberculatus]
MKVRHRCFRYCLRAASTRGPPAITDPPADCWVKYFFQIFPNAESPPFHFSDDHSPGCEPS